MILDIESISKAPKTHCVDWVETNAVVDGRPVTELTCRKWSRNLSYKRAVKYAKRNPNECTLVLGANHPNKNLYGSRPTELVPFCDYKKKISQLPMAQRIEVYNMQEHSAAGSIYYHSSDEDRAQAGYFQYKYTMPNCK